MEPALKERYIPFEGLEREVLVFREDPHRFPVHLDRDLLPRLGIDHGRRDVDTTSIVFSRGGAISGSTANTYFRYIRTFLSFCVRDEAIDTNPADTERAEEFLPEDKPARETQFWTPEQRKRLLAYATEHVEMALEGTIDVPRERAYRDRTIVVLLAKLGLRRAELFRDPNDDERAGLEWGDVDLDRGRLEVLGKSRDREPVGLTEAAHDTLARLQRVQDPPIDECGRCS